MKVNTTAAEIEDIELDNDPCADSTETFYCQARSRSDDLFGGFVKANSREEARQKFWEKNGVFPHWVNVWKK